MVCVVCMYLCLQPEIANIEKLIADRAATIRAKKEEMNRIEDEIFAKFCREIGVANIRWVVNNGCIVDASFDCADSA